MEVLIRVVCTIVWCSTIVRYTSGDGDSIKKSCQNKKCQNVLNPFELTEDDPKVGEKASHDFVQKPADLFHEVVETPDFKKITEVYDNGFYSALCWVEITTITEFKNGSNSAKREYAISFESPSNIPEKYLAKQNDEETLSYKIFDQDTQKSEVVNFTTTQRNDNETVRQHKKILCGSGPIYTKEYIEWLNSNKRKIEIRVSPKEQHLIANVCETVKENGGSTVSDVTLRQETITNLPVTNDKTVNGNSQSVVVSYRPKNSTVRSQTKVFPNNETTSINVRLGSESFSTDGEMKTSKSFNVGSSGKMTRRWEPTTDKMVEHSSQSQVENDSISTEKSATSTEAASSPSEEGPNFATSRKLTMEPQMISTRPQSSPIVVKTSTTTFEDTSFATTNIKSKTGSRRTFDHEKSTERTKLLEEFRTTHTMTVPKKGTTKSSKMNETFTPFVTISDNSKEPNVITVTEDPILNPSSQRPKNVNTPKSPENINLSTTETPRSTSSVQKIPQTTLEANYASTNIPEYSGVTFTDYQPKTTQTPQKGNPTLSTVKDKPTTESSDDSSPIELNKENFEKLNISLNDTSDKIVFRINFQTDYVMEGSQNGKRYRHRTPIVGVEKKVEFHSNFTNQALGLLKTELGYNWDKFIENLIQKFFNNRTNEGLDNIEHGKKVDECKGVGGTITTPTWGIRPPNLIPILPLNPPPYRPPYPLPNLQPMHNAESAYNKLSSMNFSNDFLTSTQQDNNPYLMFQNQTRPDHFSRPKQKYDSMNTFTYPPFRKLENDSEKNAILYKIKEPVYRLSSANAPEYATTNFSRSLLPSSRNFENIDTKTTSVLLQKILNLTKIPSWDKFDGTLGNVRHVGYRVNSYLSHGSNQFEDKEPRFGVTNFTNQDSTKSKISHNSAHWKHRTAENVKGIQMEKASEEASMPGYIKKLYDLFSASLPGNF